MLMIHQYKVGDKVRIKEREGKSIDYPCYFVDEMCQQKGKIFTIKNISELSSSRHVKRKFYNGDNHFYLFEENGYTWHSSMFEPVIEKENTDYKYGDSIKVLEYSGTIRTATYFFVNFDTTVTEHENICSKIREKCPDFCEIAKNMGAIKNISNKEYFPEFPTIERLIAFINKINELYSQKPSDESKKSIITPKTLNENEIRFQKPKTSSIRGSVPTGRAICGRRRKTAIELGHLSNTTCYC